MVILRASFLPLIQAEMRSCLLGVTSVETRIGTWSKYELPTSDSSDIWNI